MLFLVLVEMRNVEHKNNVFLMEKYVLFYLVLLISSCFPIPESAGQFTDDEFDAMSLRMCEGDVPDISIEEFLSAKESYMIFDTRSFEEYETSHIPDAHWLGYKSFDESRLKNISLEKAIVVYCSVGYRSEKIGERLQKLGYQNVQNLRGSIFQWVNEGHPVESDVKKNQIHGFNAKWSKWINSKNLEIIY